MGSGEVTASAAGVRVGALTRRQLLNETWLVLGVSLGASAIWSVLSLIRKLTAEAALNRQTTAMNSSVTPDRPWLDLAYQLTGIVLALVPVVLALHLLRRGNPDAHHDIGADLRRPSQDLLRGALLAAAVGIPGLALYAGARALGLNTTIAAANLGEQWWTLPVLVLAAAQNAVLEEVVMVGYLFTRWRQVGWSSALVISLSAAIRGAYHLYQGFGGFVGNAAMGLLFGWVYTRTRRVGPLVVAHTMLDVVAFVGYTLLRDRLSWLCSEGSEGSVASAGGQRRVVEDLLRQAGLRRDLGADVLEPLSGRDPLLYAGQRLLHGRDTRRRTADHDGDLAPDALRRPVRELRHATAADLLIGLRQLTAHGGRPVRPERLRHGPQRDLDAVRRLEEHHRAPLPRQRGQRARPLTALARQEALEAETVHRQPGHRQGHEHRARPGHARDRTPDSMAALTRRYPGSDTDGIPASVTTTTRAPPRRRSTSSGVRLASLCSW